MPHSAARLTGDPRFKVCIGWDRRPYQFVMPATAENTVESIKAKVQDQFGVSPDRQRLWLAGGIELNNGTTLRDHGVLDDMIIELTTSQGGLAGRIGRMSIGRAHRPY